MQNKREDTENLEKGKMSAIEAGRKGRSKSSWTQKKKEKNTKKNNYL
jgi:hypothetical protein